MSTKSFYNSYCFFTFSYATGKKERKRKRLRPQESSN